MRLRKHGERRGETGAGTSARGPCSVWPRFNLGDRARAGGGGGGGKFRPAGQAGGRLDVKEWVACSASASASEVAASL